MTMPRTRKDAPSELRILVADDHAVVRAGLSSLIDTEEGMRMVGEAENGEEAVRLAAELAPDVIVLDLSMPGIGAAGDELLRAIRAVAAGETYVDPRIAASLLPRPGSTLTIDQAAHPLSGREEEVLRRIAWGESNKSIAAALEISTRTVETYKARIAEKLGLRTRPEIVRYALGRGWLAEE